MSKATKPATPATRENLAAAIVAAKPEDFADVVAAQKKLHELGTRRLSLEKQLQEALERRDIEGRAGSALEHEAQELLKTGKVRPASERITSQVKIDDLKAEIQVTARAIQMQAEQVGAITRAHAGEASRRLRPHVEAVLRKMRTYFEELGPELDAMFRAQRILAGNGLLDYHALPNFIPPQGLGGLTKQWNDADAPEHLRSTVKKWIQQCKDGGYFGDKPVHRPQPGIAENPHPYP